MSYTKTTWAVGDKITTEKMNNIETGIENVVSDIATLSGQVATAAEQLEAAQSLISTNKDTIEQNASDIAANVERIQGLADDAAAHIQAAQSAIDQINGNVTAIANLRTDVDAVTVTANAAKAKADANETAISGVDGRVTALEGANHISKSQLSGLVAVGGVNVSSAQHKIVTKKNNKNITSMVWNESSGGGVQLKNEDTGIVSFIGVNDGSGDGSNILAQFYGKKISDNTGTRVNFTDSGVFMTIGKANGSHTDGDILMTKAMVNDLLGSLTERIATLESKIATLEANGAILTE